MTSGNSLSGHFSSADGFSSPGRTHPAPSAGPEVGSRTGANRGCAPDFLPTRLRTAHPARQSELQGLGPTKPSLPPYTPLPPPSPPAFQISPFFFAFWRVSPPLSPFCPFPSSLKHYPPSISQFYLSYAYTHVILLPFRLYPPTPSRIVSASELRISKCALLKQI